MPSREVFTYIDLTCICDRVHRCSPCFGVRFALFLWRRAIKMAPILFSFGNGPGRVRIAGLRATDNARR